MAIKKYININVDIDDYIVPANDCIDAILHEIEYRNPGDPDIIIKIIEMEESEYKKLPEHEF